ncbi:MAG: hypothetical protein AB7F20_14545 [Geoalkalibacter sp.]|uniref:hypothetical protein n=1 Tax=Geoalkalibacter sp. TaxID=3041440 RepID=UPI003D0CAE06
MFIDDTPANLRLLEEMLQRQGYRVLQFPSGALALKAAATHRPDLIPLETDAALDLDFEAVEARAGEFVPEELPPDKRPKYITNYIGRSRSWPTGSGSTRRRT